MKTVRPKQYKKLTDYWHGFLWHFLKPRTKKGFELIKDVKDLVRGTIYCELKYLINAYKFFKNTPGIQIIGIKDKINDLNNITINFIFEDRFIGEM